MKLHPFVESVASLRFDSCFNPYADRCEIFDHVDAPTIRAATLSSLVQCATSVRVDAIWIGRDLGYRGGRRTGLALTDDIHIEHHVERWGIKVERPTRGTVVAERTAAVVWSVLDRIDAPVFLWNVFPLHPHNPEDPFTNRQHNRHERQAGKALLKDLLELLRPRRVIAVGNDAAKAAERVAQGLPIFSVRHPSYGGQNLFLHQVETLYSLSGLSHKHKSEQRTGVASA